MHKKKLIKEFDHKKKESKIVKCIIETNPHYIWNEFEHHWMTYFGCIVSYETKTWKYQLNILSSFL